MAAKCTTNVQSIKINQAQCTQDDMVNFLDLGGKTTHCAHMQTEPKVQPDDTL